MQGDSLDDLLVEKPVREVKYAGFGIRAAALIIDNVIISLTALIIGVFIPVAAGFVWLIVLVATVILEVLSVHATPGKLILGLEVIAESQEEIKIIQVILRNGIKYIPVPFMVIGAFEPTIFYIGAFPWLFSFVDCVSALDDVKSRTYHDRISGASVIYKLK